MDWKRLFANPYPATRLAHALRVQAVESKGRLKGRTVRASRFERLALVKLARLNGVSSVKEFTRFELQRLARFPHLVRFFDGIEGKSVEFRASGWNAMTDAEDLLRLSEP